GAERRLDGAGAVDHDAGIGQLVAKLHESDAARSQHPAEICEIVSAGHLRVDNGVATKVNSRTGALHQLTLARANSVSRSSAWTASRISTAKLPGPRARAAAISPATPIMVSAATVAFQASGSTASVAPTSADAAQPIAVTFAIRG